MFQKISTSINKFSEVAGYKLNIKIINIPMSNNKLFKEPIRKK